MSRLLQREPDATADGATPNTATAPKRPQWFRLDSTQDVLPGVDPILPGQTKPFFATHKGPYTEADRLPLIKALHAREDENRPRQEQYIRHFAAKFAAMARDTAIEDMLQAGVEATKTNGFWFFVGPVLSGAIGMLFPPLGILEAAVVSANISFGLNIVQQLTTGDASEPLRTEAKRLMEADQPIFSGLEQLLEGLMDEADVAGQYGWWIEEAPPSEFGKFRIPPRIAEVSEREIGIAAAAALSAVLDQISDAQSTGQAVTLHVSLKLLAKKRAWLSGRAWVHGPTPIAESLAGARVRSLGTLPLHVELSEESGTHEALFAFLGLPPHADWERTADEKLVADLADTWPMTGPAVVERDPARAGGMPMKFGGNMAGELYLADLASPGTDWMAIIRDADSRTRQSDPDDEEAEVRLPDAQRAALNVRRQLLPHLSDGAELLLADAVNPLRLGDEEREVGWARLADWQKAIDQQRAEERQAAEQEKLIRAVGLAPPFD